jgi:hypothetical protein
MTSFFLGIWQDLREKRLWPAAVGLLAAIVAVPVVLFKPASDGTPPSATTHKGDNTPTLPVVHVAGGPVMGSHLEAFSASEKNPFKPMKDLAKADSGSTAGPAASGGSGASGGGTSTTGGSATGGTGGSSGSASGGSSPAGGGSTPSNGGSTTTKTTKWFHYVADFSFGETGAKATTFKSRASYTLLPDENKPVVVFLGLSDDHKTALFFVSDPGIQADGEGTCVGKDSCQFVTLSTSDTGDEENFSAIDGSVSYDLTLLGIKRQELGTGTQPATPTAPKAGKALADTGQGVAAAAATTQSLLPAAFAGGPGLAVEQK